MSGLPQSSFRFASRGRADSALSGAIWTEFCDELTKLSNLSKSPAAANTIQQSVKGIRPKARISTTNPGIMPVGQSGVTATTSPPPKMA